MAVPLENVILELLAAPAKGFEVIKQLFKDPSVYMQLCSCMTESSEIQVRRYSAVLLRRKLLKAKYWKKIPPDVKLGLKNTVLKAYVAESEKSVRNTLVDLIAAIAKHEFPNGNWPDLMTFLNESIRGNDSNVTAEGLYCLSVIAESIGAKLKPHFKGLLIMFQKTLADRSNVEVPYHTILALTHMVPSIGTEELNLFQTIVPNVIAVIRLLAAEGQADEHINNQAKAIECLEIFDELVESEVAVLAPHLKSLVELCLELASKNGVTDELRIKAVNTVAYLIRLKKKSIIKQRLAQPILDIFFPLMCLPSPGDADDDDINDDDWEQSLASAAGQALDVMALHLPPAKLIPMLMHHLQAAFESPLPLHRKGAYLAISVIAEGCSEYIRHKHLSMFVTVIIRGVKDSDVVVRNSALYAVGQYAEYLQPEISKYAAELLPVLFEYLQQMCILLQQGNQNIPSLTRTFYAVERFCENLEDIQPFLPTLMSCLTTFLTINTKKAAVVKELAVEAIGSVAAAAKSDFLPYFSPIMAQLQSFISENQTDETRPLQIQAIDTLAIIARTVGAETFLPIAHDCVKCGLHLMEQNDDPDIRRACYGLFASLSVVLKTGMEPYLKIIVEKMITTLQSTEGLSLTTESGGVNPQYTLFDEGDEEDTEENGEMKDESVQNLVDLAEEDDDNDDDITGLNVENAYMEEKEGALLGLRELCESTGMLFLPYFELSFDEVKKKTEHLSEDVRRSAIGTLGQFCITLNQVFLETGNLEYRVALDQNLNTLFPKILSLSREDTEHTVVLGCLETLQNVIDRVKQNCLCGGNVESICLLLKDIFKNKLACQDEAGEGEGEEEEQEAEYDNLLLEYAGEIIAILIKVVPWSQFAPYLAGLMPFLLNKSKKACTISEKSFSIGTLADIVNNMELGAVQPFIGHLQPVFLSGMKEENEEVRSNAVFGLGSLAQNAGGIVFDQYPIYLQALSNMFATEEDSRAKDNICGAIARLIKTNVAGVPLKEVFPVFLASLPLKEDMEENVTVYECLTYLYGIRCEQVFESLPQLLQICSDSLTTPKETHEKTVSVVSSFLNRIYMDFPNEFETVLKSMPVASAEALVKARSLPPVPTQ